MMNKTKDIEYRKEKDRLIKILAKNNLLLELLSFVNKKGLVEVCLAEIRYFVKLKGID